MWGQTASQKREIIKNDKISLPENRDRKEGVAMYKYTLTSIQGFEYVLSWTSIHCRHVPTLDFVVGRRHMARFSSSPLAPSPKPSGDY